MTEMIVTWDYRCPFARNAHEHLLVGLADGADWDVRFVPFSLGQVHVEEGQTPIWERPGDDSGLLALQVGVHVRDTDPDAFPGDHRDHFALRHDHGGHLNDRDAVAKVLADHGVDAEAAFAAVDDGSLLATVKAEHEAAANEHEVWGVPTFVLDGEAAFVRLMDRPGDDAAHARASIDRIIALLGVPQLNEFKHTSIAR
jgi:2-hydroxychromene-2-carboxylate isomerase